MFELTETAPGITTVRFTLDLRPGGLTELLTPMIARQVRHEVAQLDTLKAVLETACWSRQTVVSPAPRTAASSPSKSSPHGPHARR